MPGPDDERQPLTTDHPAKGTEPAEGVSETIDSASPLHTEPRPGETAIGKYRVIEQLGRGGQGVVYRAVHPTLGRDVVIKLSNRRLWPGDEQRLFEEGRVLARLDDPGVVRVYDVDSHDGLPFIVFEYVAGQSLAERLKARRFGVREAAALAAEIAAIVERIQRQGVIHRDLKPGNILLDAQGRPRLLDFGLASLTQPWQEADLGASVVGTLAYMAPEQARAEPGAVGPRTDVYGVGAILYQMLAGRPPRQAAAGESRLQLAREGRVTPLRDVAPSVPGALQRICHKALAPRPGDRYASAAELARDLRRYLRRRTFALGALAAAAVLIAAGAIAFLRRPGNEANAPQPTPIVAPPAIAPKPRPPTAAPNEPPPGWREYAPKDAGFAVWLPGLPKESSSAVKTSSRDVTMRRASLVDGDAGLYFDISYGDLVGIAGQVEQRLDKARDGMLSKVDGKVLQEQSVQLGAHPGREVYLEINRGGKTVWLRTRIFLVGQRVFHLQILGSRAAIDTAPADRFFESFRIAEER